MSNSKNKENLISSHGVLIYLNGTGVLIQGKSGIGKSECAVELINKGAYLVSDDIVVIEKINDSLIGKAPEQTEGLIEIRGIGIVNIKEIFGIKAIKKKSKVDLIIELIQFNDKHDYERLGYDRDFLNMLGIDVPIMKIPVSPGRNLSTLIEIAVKKIKLETLFIKNT